ncbi:MAG TPA: DUF459 domain-containing protein [Acidimicrobiia bacterium]|jgi:hypothetical protein|nr:DUF459 domain-containing protein [Acidimicrobiia bacterium]
MSNEGAPNSEIDDGTRRARLASRRRRRTRVAIAIIAAVAVAAAVAVGAYAYTNDDEKAANGPDAAGNTTPFGERGGLPEVVAKSAAVRALDHANPLRLWVGGDSLAGSFGPALGDMVGATGIVKTRIDYKVSSGLWSNDIRDWSTRATEEMAADDPELIVFMIGTNDTPVVNKVDANNDGTPDWEVSYRAKVDHMMDTFVGANHRMVLWLGAPTLGTNQNSAAIELDRVMQEEASKRGPDVAYVDTYKLFEDENGEYSSRILDENGKQIYARISDGVHFSEDGAKYLARAVLQLIEARWHLLKQADTAEPIGWSYASGSGELVPGYNSGSHSRYHYTPNTRYVAPTTDPPVVTTPPTIVTTPPSTAPVATTVPATVSPTTVASPPTSSGP